MIIITKQITIMIIIVLSTVSQVAAANHSEKVQWMEDIAETVQVHSKIIVFIIGIIITIKLIIIGIIMIIIGIIIIIMLTINVSN